MRMNYLLKRRAGLILCIALASSVTSLWANVPGKGGSPSPATPPYGRTYDVLSLEWWLWDFMLPVPNNPTVTPGVPCTNGQTGNVWFLYAGPPTVTCTVPAGKMLFFPIVDTECSSLEAPPFHGDTPEERQACAKGWIDYLTNIAASIDGVPVQNLHPLRTRSGDFSFTVPDNNILVGSGPAWGFSSADGYYILLNPLPAGDHTIHVQGTFHDPNDPAHPPVFTIDTLMTLHVQ